MARIQLDQRRALPTLRDGPLTLRPATGADVAALVEVLADPEVVRWWGEHDEAEVRADLDRQPVWTIEVDAAVVGWLQVGEEGLPFPSVAFDIALAGQARGRGLGQAALRLAVGHFAAAGHHRFTIDPAVENEAAIRSYRAVGFKPVGVLRAYEHTSDGSWRDGLLMDLLVWEFDGGPVRRPGTGAMPPGSSGSPPG